MEPPGLQRLIFLVHEGPAAWQITKILDASEETRCDSCCFGSPHLKSFRFLGINADLEPVRRRCKCRTKHLVVQGKYTKHSATYTDGLAAALGSIFSIAIRKRKADMQDLDSIATRVLKTSL